MVISNKLVIFVLLFNKNQLMLSVNSIYSYHSYGIDTMYRDILISDGTVRNDKKHKETCAKNRRKRKNKKR